MFLHVLKLFGFKTLKDNTSYKVLVMKLSTCIVQTLKLILPNFKVPKITKIYNSFEGMQNPT